MLATNLLEPLFVAMAAVALAGLIHGTLGVGFPLVSTPIIALATDVKTAILLTLAPTLAVNIISVLRGGHWRDSVGRYWPVAVLVLVGSIIGTYILIVSDPAPFKLLLAAVIIFYLWTSRANGGFSWAWIRRHPRASGALFGSLGGLTAGTVNVAVPVLIIYFSELRLAPVALVQIINLCFLGGKAAQVGTFALAGQLGQDILLMSLPLMITATLMLFIGMKLRNRVATETYRRWLRKMLAVIAFVLIAQFVLQA